MKKNNELADVLVKKSSDQMLVDGIATFVNPYSYLKLRKEFMQVEEFDRIYLDGSLMVVLSKLMGIKVKRISFDFTGIAESVLLEARGANGSIVLVGGAPGIALEAATIFKQRVPGLTIRDVYDGFFESTQQRENILKKIMCASPEYVLVGMGTPLQEQFLSELKSMGWNGTGYTCGGFFHQTARAGGDYYPRWMDTLNLRWLYRMINEPQTRKRYLFFYPWAVVVFLWDSIKLHIKKLVK